MNSFWQGVDFKVRSTQEEQHPPECFWLFQKTQNSSESAIKRALRSIMILAATKKVQRLPEVKPNHLFCPFQVSGSEGRNSTSSKGWQWRESAASGSRELTSPPACPGLTPTLPQKQQHSSSSSSRLNNKLTSRIQVNHGEEGGPATGHRNSFIPQSRQTRLEGAGAFGRWEGTGVPHVSTNTQPSCYTVNVPACSDTWNWLCSIYFNW